jgi:hypothetical protein
MGTKDTHSCQLIFFWDESRSETGIIELVGSDTLHVTKIRDRQRKLVRDAGYRAKWLQPLEFPVERYWPAPE